VQINKKEYVAVSRFPLTSVLGLAVTLQGYKPKNGTPCSPDQDFPVPCREREIRRVQQLSFWTVAISLRAVEQKLQ
jgi:hypothetical protein